MFRKKYNIIVFGICAFLFILSAVIIGLNASNNRKYDLTRELYDNKISISLNDNSIQSDISSIKWKTHKGDFLGKIDLTRFDTEIEDPKREKGDTTPIKPEEYVLNFKFDLSKDFDGEFANFTLERLTILEENIEKSNAIEKYGKLEEMTLSQENEKRFVFSDVRQDIEDPYYQIYVLHYTPLDADVIENYWYFGVYFDVIPDVENEK